MTSPPDPAALLRSRPYLALLALAAIIGVPISAVAYGFLALVSKLQQWIFTDLPKGLGFHGTPLWWPLPALALAGLLVALTLRYLPGTGGHSPADGLQAGGPPPAAIDLPGVALAALATLSLGAVLGPEAPLIALGGGLGACAVRLARKDAPPQVATMMAAAGSFTAISTLFGSPLLGAFLLMEAAGIAGATLELVLVPGPARRGDRLAHLHRPGPLDRARRLLAGDTRPAPGRDADRRRIRLGAGHRGGRRRARVRDPVARPAAAAARGAPDPARHADRRPGRRGAGHRVRGGHRQGLQ